MGSGRAAIRIVASAAIAVATLYGVFIGGAWSGQHNSDLRTATLAIAVTAIVLWAIAAVLDASWRPRTVIMPALLVPLVVLALTTATSRQPRLGLDYVAWSVVLVALYLLLVRLMASPFFRSKMLALATLLALIVGIWFIQEVVAKWLDWWGLVGRVSPPPLRPEFASLSFGNPSAVMAMSILLGLPSVAWIGFASRGRIVASIAILALAASSTALSGSRAGWLGLAIGWTVAVGLWLSMPSHRALVGTVIRSRAVRWGLAGAAVVAIVAGVVLVPGVLFRAGTGGEGLRIAYWQAAIRMFAEAPLLGTGPGTWVAQRIAYTDVPGNDYTIPHAHDIYVQTLAETGIVGALAGLVVLVVIVRLAARAVRSGDQPRVLMGWAAVFALTYFAGHQLLDFYPDFPAALIAIAIPIAWLDAAEQRSSPGAPATVAAPNPRLVDRLAPALGGIAALALSVGFLTWSESWATKEEAAVDALNDGNIAAALAPAREAAAGDPAMPSYQFTLGLAASKTGNPAEAAAAYARGAAADDLPASWLGLAGARVQLGDAGGARDALQKALRLGVVQPAIAIAAADLYAKLGDPETSGALLTTAILDDPRLAGDPNLPGPDPAAAIDRALATANPVGRMVIALEAGRRPAADAAVATMAEPSRTAYARIVAAWFGDPAARQSLEDDARQHPLDLDLVTWVARVVEHVDPAAAGRYIEWANIVNGNSGSAAQELRVATAGERSDGSGFFSTFYGHYTYRRPTPWDQTPGGVVGLVLR